MLLWIKLATEMAGWCCTDATMDIKYVQGRVEHEGLSFLTITLADFGKDFQKSLDLGHVDRHLFTGFRWKGGLPLFLGGFLDRVFDRQSGALLNGPCIDSILAVRQLTLMFSKIELPCSQARVFNAMRQFVESEQDVKAWDKWWSTEAQLQSDFHRVSHLLFGKALEVLNREVVKLRDGYPSRVIPKHGPGATADKLMGNRKFNQRAWTERLEDILPYGEMCLPNWSFYDQLEDVDILEPGAELPVRVISVPKTLKTPRIIAIEPTAMQYAQQGLLRGLLDCLFSASNPTHRELQQMIGFEDQTPNQRMAQEGSLTGDLATLDLSEASDRVSNQLIRTMLRWHPELNQAVDACRSRRADVPWFGVKRLSKFASMGSALTFPMEAMVFLTLVFLGIERELSAPLNRKTIKQFSGRVRVYGDDIIVPVDYVHSVNAVLETFGSRVNRGKSFWTGRFRESCGKEYYAGHDVSIVKVRQMFPVSRKDATGVISLVSLRNQFYWLGAWSTVKWLDREIVGVIRHFPTVLPTSPVLGRHSVLGFETQRLSASLHSPLVKGWVVDARIPPNSLEGPGALLKYFLKQGDEPFADKKHLERSGRPHAVSIKLRNASPI